MDPDTLRAALVETLQAKGCLGSAAIAGAFATVPRHVFVPHVPVEEAYRDHAIPTKRLDDGEVVSSSSQPEIMATMLEQLGVRPGHRVLEIGAGTGYNAALLAHLVGPEGHVTTMDIDDDIVAAARAHLEAAGVRGVRVVQGDGWAGDADGAPYDRIVLTVGAHDISPAWRAQLAPNGRLVLPLALPAVQASVAFDPRQGGLESVSVRGCLFMRLRGAATVPMRRVAIGSVPAPVVVPRGDHVVDGDVVDAFLRAPHRDLPTDLVVAKRALYDGLVAWLALHEPTSAWLLAEGKAMAAGLVPALFDASAEVATTFGLFEPAGVALLLRAETSPAPADGHVAITVRTHGSPDVGERLRAAVRGWDAAGRPRLERLRVRAYPIESPYAGTPRETVITRPCTRLVLDWPA